MNPATLKSMAAEVVTLAATESSSHLQQQQQQQQDQRTAVSEQQIGSSNVVSSFALSQSSNLSKSTYNIHSVPVIWFSDSDIWSFWLYFGYMVFGKRFPLYEISEIWSFRLYDPF